MEERILALNKLGYNIAQLINPINNESKYFLFDQFIPVESIGQVQTFKHKIKGKNITNFLNERASILYPNTSQHDEVTIRTQINALPLLSVEYSSHFLWINFLVK
jgi:hypothetical protein